MLTKDDIRAAGGIVHGDGNVFFTNIDQLNAALLEKLRSGMELPEPQQRYVATHAHDFGFSRDQLLQYGDARVLAARERAIEEWRVHLLELWEKGNFDLKDAIKETYSALAASPQEQT